LHFLGHLSLANCKLHKKIKKKNRGMKRKEDLSAIQCKSSQENSAKQFDKKAKLKKEEYK